MAGISAPEQAYESDPIDIVESIAIDKEWDFDRLGDDHIAMAVDGMWHSYSITLSWSCREETLRMICSFDLAPQTGRIPLLLDAMNSINDHCWTGGFTLLPDQQMVLFRYGLVLSGGSLATKDQIEHLVSSAVGNCDMFFPVIQSANLGREPVSNLLALAVSSARGSA